MTKKIVFRVLAFAIVLSLSVPVYHIVMTKLSEQSATIEPRKGFVDDESHLNLTRIREVIDVPSDKDQIIEQLQGILKHANEHGLKVSIAGAKHSMGGHTMYPGGIVLNMLPYNHMKLDTTEQILTVGSGALWDDALQLLDKHGLSIAIMQSFSSFSIGGSLSVNGHGWQKNVPPLSQSVIEFTLLKANGELVTCSRIQNQELFALAIGGYGLFGVILDVKLRLTRNSLLRFKSENMPTSDYLKNYKSLISDNPNVDLVFGRLRVSKKNFLEDALINYFERTYDASSVKTIPNSDVKRLVFRSSVDSEYGKRLRWNLEAGANALFSNSVFSRNELLSESDSLIRNLDTASTDILHEYFIPESNFYSFIEGIKPHLLNSKIDLLNVTIRRVEEDKDSFLKYARTTVYGFVFLFNQEKTSEQELEMKRLTNLLVDVVIQNNGTFYLPYRLHIDKNKMRSVYPQANSFFELKRKYDQSEIFNNKFYSHYN